MTYAAVKFRSSVSMWYSLPSEADKRGVSPNRLVSASRMELADHLARHRQADLFLDTFYYNARTTASDALWVGLPVLTCLGGTFAGRVAGGLLKAVGFPELITRSHEECESLAVELASNAPRLAEIKTRLAENRMTHPLFDTAQFTRHFVIPAKAGIQRFQWASWMPAFAGMTTRDLFRASLAIVNELASCDTHQTQQSRSE